MISLIVATAGIFRQPASPDAHWWFNPRVHNLGNTGFLGSIHAHSAKLFTGIIDDVAYNGRNIRNEILSEIPKNAKICDMGCGVGLSTHDNALTIGIDTSKEMLEVAKKVCKDKLCTLKQGNAVSYGENDEFDYATIFYLLHEAPQNGRIDVIENAMRISSNGVLIVNIHPNLKPSKAMLSGEPYLTHYLKHIRKDVLKCCYYNDWHIYDTYTYIENHIMVWALRPNKIINTLPNAEVIG